MLAGLGGKEREPTVVLGLFDDGVDVRVVLDMELLQIVLGIARLPAVYLGLFLGEQAVRSLQHPSRRVVVYLLDDIGELGSDGAELLVHHKVLVVEDEVVCSERLTVRPLEPLAQLEGVLGGILAGRPGFAYSGHHAVPVPGELHQLVVANVAAQVVPVGLHRTAGPFAPVLADTLRGRYDDRLLREALLDGRELSLGHQLCEHRGFLEPRRSGRFGRGLGRLRRRRLRRRCRRGLRPRRGRRLRRTSNSDGPCRH